MKHSDPSPDRGHQLVCGFQRRAQGALGVRVVDEQPGDLRQQVLDGSAVLGQVDEQGVGRGEENVVDVLDDHHVRASELGRHGEEMHGGVVGDEPDQGAGVAWDGVQVGQDCVAHYFQVT